MTPFYTVESVPVHSCLLLRDLDRARSFPKGDIQLAFCGTCGFVSNTRFDAGALTYTTDYEETQGFSPRFNAFANALARRLVDTYDLRDKDVLEIGCGKGEFLALLCELGDNRGVGIDPTSIPGRLDPEKEARIAFIQDFYSERYAHLTADFICCRHTLEHIYPTRDFLTMLRANIGDRQPIVFFEVPDVSRVLKELAFWDVYYEHCSYFSPGSLARLFRSCGFEVLEVSRGFDDQYLLIEARPSTRTSATPMFPGEDDIDDLADSIAYFQTNLTSKVKQWRADLDAIRSNGQRVVLWGSGSKAVAYLHSLGVTDEIEYVVDINPYKQDMYLAGSGHLIVAPEFLKQYRPDVVIAMNSTYLAEIAAMLDDMHVEARLIGL
jgi:SAM-dependent methyltransferase